MGFPLQSFVNQCCPLSSDQKTTCIQEKVSSKWGCTKSAELHCWIWTLHPQKTKLWQEVFKVNTETDESMEAVKPQDGFSNVISGVWSHSLCENSLRKCQRVCVQQGSLPHQQSASVAAPLPKTLHNASPKYSWMPSPRQPIYHGRRRESALSPETLWPFAADPDYDGPVRKMVCLKQGLPLITDHNQLFLPRSHITINKMQ